MTTPKRQAGDPLAAALPEPDVAPVADESKPALEEAADTAKAAGFGALQGLTGNLFGYAVGSGRQARNAEDAALYPATVKLRKLEQSEEQARLEAHPYAKGVGEFAGMLLSPATEIAEGAKLLKAGSVAGRLGQEALGQAAVGTLYGAGSTLSDAALGDAELTADKLIAGAGLGAVLGAGGGLLGGAITEGAKALVPALAKSVGGAQQGLEDFANDRWLKAAGALKSDLGKIPEERIPAIADVLREHIPSTGSKTAGLESAEASFEKLGKRIGELVKEPDKAGVAPTMDVAKALADMKLNPLEEEAIAGEAQKLQEAFDKSAAKGSGFEGAHDLLHTFGRRANWKAFEIGTDPVLNATRKELYSSLRAEFDAQVAPHLGSDVAKEYLETNAKYGATADALRLLKRGVNAEKGNNPLSLSGMIAGAAVGAGELAAGNPLGLIKGAGAAIGAQLLRDRGSAIAAQLADRIAASPALSTIATSFAARLPSVSPQLGPYAAALAQAAAQSPHRALAEHMVLAQTDPGYQQAAQLAGLMPETPEQHGAALLKAHGVAQVAGAVAEHDKAMDRAVETAIKGAKAPASSREVHTSQDFGTKRMRRPDTEAHEKRVEEVRRMAADPNALVERVTANLGNLHNVAPSVAAALTAKANAAVQFLTNESRTPSKAGPLAPAWQSTEHERWLFAAKLEAVENPLAVLKHVASGTVTADQVRAIRAVYPTLHRDLSERIIKRVTTAKAGSVPYAARLSLSLFVGQDLDGTMNPASIAANQAAIHRPSEKPSNAGAPASKAGDLTLAQRTATPTQRREMSEEA